jgi:hypothetical protein
MSLVYADTSALFAYFYPHDEFSSVVDNAVKAKYPDFIYWPPVRFELRRHLRRLKVQNYGVIAWRALRAAESNATRLRWYGDLTLDKVLESAEELSAEHAVETHCGSIDVLHIASARRVHLPVGLDEFWTCDETHAELSRKVGLRTRLFAR